MTWTSVWLSAQRFMGMKHTRPSFWLMIVPTIEIVQDKELRIKNCFLFWSSSEHLNVGFNSEIQCCSCIWSPDWLPKKSRVYPWLCTTPPLTPKSQIFEPTTMHYSSTIDPQNIHFEPTTMHYTTITPKNPRPLTQTSKIRAHDHALHHHSLTPKGEWFEPTTCTTSPLTPTKSKIRTHDHALIHHYWQPPLTLQWRSWLLMTSLHT
jgi:hypothetical protein